MIAAVNTQSNTVPESHCARVCAMLSGPVAYALLCAGAFVKWREREGEKERKGEGKQGRREAREKERKGEGERGRRKER